MGVFFFWFCSVVLNFCTFRGNRRVRVWGDAGQERLEDAHVCVINSSALGTESLKSLVLPGIGAFTLIDGKNCTVRDLGRNFFVTEDQVRCLRINPPSASERQGTKKFPPLAFPSRTKSLT